MIWAVRQLFSPVRYLLIKQGVGVVRSKFVYDWILPAILALFSLVVCLIFAPHAPMFDEHGIVGRFEKLLEILVPFYIVALAAVATFAPGTELDQPMKGHPATISLRRATGDVAEHILTRRQFVCYLFGYLASVSLFLFVLILLLSITEERLAEFFKHLLGSYSTYFKYLVLYAFLLPIWQIIVTTLLGVFFMSERIQVMADPHI